MNYSYTSIEAIKRAHKRAWFEPANMRFFSTRILPTVYGGRYFITSEQCRFTDPRRYSIRVVDEHGDIDTVGEFQRYPTRAAAIKAVKVMP